MADPVWQDNVTPLNAVNMTKLQTRDEKAAVNGYASLDGTGKVPAGQLPAIGVQIPAVVNGQWIKGVGGAAVWTPIVAGDITSAVNGQFLKGAGGVGSWAAIAVADVSGAQSTAQKGAANGYASLDGNAKVPVAQIYAAADPLYGKTLQAGRYGPFNVPANTSPSGVIYYSPAFGGSPALVVYPDAAGDPNWNGQVKLSGTNNTGFTWTCNAGSSGVGNVYFSWIAVG